MRCCPTLIKKPSMTNMERRDSTLKEDRLVDHSEEAPLITTISSHSQTLNRYSEISSVVEIPLVISSMMKTMVLEDLGDLVDLEDSEEWVEWEEEDKAANNSNSNREGKIHSVDSEALVDLVVSEALEEASVALEMMTSLEEWEEAWVEAWEEACKASLSHHLALSVEALDLSPSRLRHIFKMASK